MQATGLPHLLASAAGDLPCLFHFSVLRAFDLHYRQEGGIRL